MTWILIADGSHANLFSRTSEQDDLHLVESWNRPDGRTPDHESETDHLGSGGGGRGKQGSTLSPATDPKRHAQEVFARELAGTMKERVGEYDELVVVAAPRFLGELRREFEAPVLQKIVAEIHKDLTHSAAHDLAQHLAKLLKETRA